MLSYKTNKLDLEVEKRFNAKIDNSTIFKPQKQISGFDHSLCPIITDEEPHIITDYHWGLILSWSKDENLRQSNLNARIETLEEKPSFKN